MTEIDIMIFDFDGTLVSTGKDIAAAVNYTLEKLSLPVKNEDEIIAFVGDGVVKLIERTLGSETNAHFPEAVKIFGKYYSEHLLDNTVLYPGVEDLLKYFDNKIKIILTNKRYNFTLDICKRLDIEKYFLEIIGDGSLPYRKPDVRLTDYVLNKYKGSKEKTVIIGDGINDVVLARNSGIWSCAYLNGLGRREELIAADADFYYERISDIKSFFC